MKKEGDVQDSLPCPRVDSLSWFELGKQNAAVGVGLGCSPLPSAIAIWGDNITCDLFSSCAELHLELQMWGSCHGEQVWLREHPHTRGLTSSQAPDSGKSMSSGNGFKPKVELRLFTVTGTISFTSCESLCPSIPLHSATHLVFVATS